MHLGWIFRDCNSYPCVAFISLLATFCNQSWLPQLWKCYRNPVFLGSLCCSATCVSKKDQDKERNGGTKKIKKELLETQQGKQSSTPLQPNFNVLGGKRWEILEKFESNFFTIFTSQMKATSRHSAKLLIPKSSADRQVSHSPTNQPSSHFSMTSTMSPSLSSSSSSF